MDYTNVDEALVVKTSINAPDIKFYDVRKEPFEIYGLYKPETEDVFKRMPDDVAKNVNDGVAYLYTETAGGRVRFCTDSEYIAIHAEYSKVSKYSHMPLAATAGFDLFEDSEDGRVSRFTNVFMPPMSMDKSYESKVNLEGGKKLRYFTINFPTYSSVTNLYIGLQKDAYVGKGVKYINKKPVVYYGSSITQGACPSRPGNTYQGFISRTLGLDFVNLGFSGNGKGEDLMVDYLSKMDMSVYVCDYDNNAPDAKWLRETHQKMYDTIRKAKPDVPYIMISRPDVYVNYDSSVERRNVVMDSYNYARSKGDKHVYYIDGEGMFLNEFYDACTVDKSHPNDLGFAFMAKSIEGVLRRIMVESNILD